MKKLTYPKQKKSFCVGVTDDNEVVFAEIEIGSCDNDHYTVTHTTFCDIMTEREGEEKAREYLEDGELWKMAVESGNTTSGLSDWVDEVLSMDGWEPQLDVTSTGEHNGIDYYMRWASCGASIDDFKREYKKLFLTTEDLKTLIESDPLHLKDFKTYTKKEKALFERVLKLFDKPSQELEDVKDLIPLLLDN